MCICKGLKTVIKPLCIHRFIKVKCSEKLTKASIVSFKSNINYCIVPKALSCKIFNRRLALTELLINYSAKKGLIKNIYV